MTMKILKWMMNDMNDGNGYDADANCEDNYDNDVCGRHWCSMVTDLVRFIILQFSSFSLVFF